MHKDIIFSHILIFLHQKIHKKLLLHCTTSSRSFDIEKVINIIYGNTGRMVSPSLDGIFNMSVAPLLNLRPCA